MIKATWPLLLTRQKDADDPERTSRLIPDQIRLLDSLLSSIVDSAYIIDAEGRFIFANQALLDRWQMTSEDAVGKTFFELPYSPSLAVQLDQQIKTVFATGRTLKDETAYTDPSGATGYYEYIFVPVFDNEKRVEFVAGTTHDITARHNDEEEKAALVKTLEVERARLTSLFMQTPAFIAVLRGPQHVFELVNPPYYQLVGKRDLLGKPVRDIFPDVEGQGFFELLDQVYQTGIPFIGKDMPIVFQVTPDATQRQRFMDFVYQPMIEADGSVSGIFAHGVDLTERKQALQEVRDLNARLQRAMAETHHRVKNNLQVLSGLVEISHVEGESPALLTALERLQRHINALASLHNLLTLDSQDTDGSDAPSLRVLLEKLAPMLQLASGERPLRMEAQDVRLPMKQASSFALLVNELIANAIKHGQGEIHLTVTEENAGKEKDRIRLAVSDEGPGFPEGFDPAQNGNTGLELIRSLGEWDLQGKLFFSNLPGGGACVGISFPRPVFT